MELITVREIYRNKEEYIGKQIQVGGWIRSIRDSKAFGFIVLSDGSFFEPLQIVYHDNMDNFARGFQAERGRCDHRHRYAGSDTAGKAAF